LDEPVRRSADLHAQGLLAYQSGRHADAVHLITQSLLLDDGAAEAYCNLGCAYAALGGDEEALRCFAFALRRNPAFDSAARNAEVLQSNAAMRNLRRETYVRAEAMSEELRAAASLLDTLEERFAKP